MVSVMAFVIASSSSRGVVQELVASLGSSVVWLACGVGGTIRDSGVMASAGQDGFEVKASIVDPIP